MKKESKQLWNRNFFLLWQGQLVSAFGDALYAIALNLFVLELTGSTAVMGTIMALVTVPKVLLGTVFRRNGRPGGQKETDRHRRPDPGT